ncbi:hypothetical protein [Olsenella sp. HMSC062G07]|uniref:hypothetical protein n=1 Tax=Olsenella sp. HMSC062G07 TaxID=1739330 RepID=UPI0008A6538E|nr:hypothetical protein [Olsenella sp. HMSC062G07]OFK24832.1 hypothetical protein HMPREF2826_06325 [Olsenella sp. HMSC062G07]
MPAVLTHDFFGRDAYPLAADALGLLSLAQHDAFMLGSQGPDPLFYLRVVPRVKARDLAGGQMHHQRPALLLASLHDALSMLSRPERGVGVAYAAGFLCHYLLDRSVHPLVFSQEYGICDVGVEGLDRSCGTVVHAEIERDLDEMVLFAKTGQTVEGYQPHRHVLAADADTLRVIDKLFFYMNLWTFSRTLSLDCYTRGVKAFRLAQRALFASRGGRGRVLCALERRLGHRRYSLVGAMAHRARKADASPFANSGHEAWIDPFTGALSSESFWDRYEGALATLPGALDTFLAAGFDLAAARELTGDLNFSGQPVDPDALDDPAEPRPGVTLGEPEVLPGRACGR